MPRIADRFRGFLPVVVDVETGGFNAQTDALLEIAASIIRMDDFGRLFVAETLFEHVEPFPGSRIDPKSLEFTGIRLDSPLRQALPERRHFGVLPILCAKKSRLLAVNAPFWLGTIPFLTFPS
jgi:ribonuclease T